MPTATLHAQEDAFASSIEERRWFGDDDSLIPHQRARESAPARIARFIGLRPLPHLARHAIACVQDTLPRRSALVQLVRSDVGLATKIVRYAGNVHRSAGPVTSIDDALGRIGRRMLPGLIASAATEALLSDPEGTYQALQDHSLGTATLAVEIARAEGRTDLDQVYTCGLFHDLGRLVKLQSGLDAPDDPMEEVAADGYDHAVLGAEILNGWHVAPEVHRLVALHHHPGRAFRHGGDLPARVGEIELADRLDEVIARDGTARDALDAARGGDFTSYLRLDAAALKSLWPRLVDARARALAAYPATEGPLSVATRSR